MSSDIRARVAPAEPLALHHHKDLGLRTHSVSTRSVVTWLLATALTVLVTLVVGGITRLTESGLSITEWKPLWGALPPMSAADWEQAFSLYLRIPEAQTVHAGITLAQFKSLFWWEWLHRNFARLAGLIIAVPYLWLLARGAIPQHLKLRLGLLPLLVGAQGALGWYMVSSGLSERTDVSQYRLAAHLGLALVIYVIAVWSTLDLLGKGDRSGAVDKWGVALSALVFGNILSGAFVAGLDAGHIYNSFPLMGDGFLPPGATQLTPLWRNAFENPATVQFLHRVFALITFSCVVALGVRAILSRSTRPRWLGVSLIGMVSLQAALGIATLLLAVPIPLAALHQLGAVALLTLALIYARTQNA